VISKLGRLMSTDDGCFFKAGVGVTISREGYSNFLI